MKSMCHFPTLLSIFVVSIALHTAIVLAADIPFHSDVVTSTSPTDPWEKAVGDINLDGQQDMVVGGPTGPLIWYAAPSWTPTTIAGSGSYNSACGIAIADIDNDGDPDVVMGGITWFENPLPGGDPSGGNWTSHPVGSHSSHDIVVADLDGDNRLDMVSRNQGGAGNVINIYQQVNPDSWVLKTIPAVSGEGLTLADFDNDGDLDIAIARQWYENTGNIVGGAWTAHDIAPAFNQVAVVKSADINHDGRVDLIVSASETSGEVAWYECPANPKSGTWTGHTLGTSMDSVHGLGVADFDGDGDVDIAASEFRGSGRLIVFHNENRLGTSWSAQVLGNQQLHNIVVVDYDGDSDYDIFGAYCWDNPPAYLWINESGPYLLGLDDWSYINIDSSRASQYFGLAMGDGNGDGVMDIGSGTYFYHNPGGDLSGTWQRVTMPVESDANFITDVDGDGLADIISQALPDLYWFEAVDSAATSFTAHLVATGIGATGHGNSQGYTMGEIVGGGRQEIVLSSGGGLYFIQIPESPEAGNWLVVNITPNAPEEGVAIGDIDGDGDNDVAAWVGTGSGSTVLGWWKNSGDGSGNWPQHGVGNTVSYEGDRVEIGDINGDGRKDIIVTETNDGTSGNAVHWFECPADPLTTNSWTRHTVASNLGGLNSMDVRDMNNDGLLDIVTGEHRGEKRVVIWENIGGGSSWTGHTVDSGKESHLGVQTGDLDNDGDFDIVSICWDDYPMMHLWRNDARTVTNLTDNEAPVLRSVRTTGSATVLIAEFSESVTAASAENIGSYSITDGVNVFSATLAADSKTVILTTGTLSQGTAYTLAVAGITDTSGNILVSSERVFVYDPQELFSGLAGYWPLDEEAGTTAADISGNDFDGVLQNGATWAQAKFGGGVHLDGADDYVSLPNIDVSGGAISLSAWFNSSQLDNCSSNDCRIISKATGTGESDHYWMLSTINSGGATRLRFRLKTGSSTTTLIAGSGTITNNSWVHGVAVYDGSQMRLYQNAELVGSVAKTGDLATNPAVSVNIGRNPDGYGPWLGTIDDVRIYNRPFSEKEIQALYQGFTYDGGDVNHDGGVDLVDLILCLQTLSGGPTSQQMYPDADVDGSNKLGIAEAIYILQEAAGL